MDGRIIEVHVTCGSLREAKKISEVLIKESLVACASINEMESTYIWRGKSERHSEWLVNLKTTEAAYERVEKRTRENHSYELPSIFAINIEKVHEGYRKWVQENVKV